MRIGETQKTVTSPKREYRKYNAPSPDEPTHIPTFPPKRERVEREVEVEQEASYELAWRSLGNLWLQYRKSLVTAGLSDPWGVFPSGVL